MTWSYVTPEIGKHPTHKLCLCRLWVAGIAGKKHFIDIIHADTVTHNVHILMHFCVSVTNITQKTWYKFGLLL